MISIAHLVYFSPTGSTEKIVSSVALGLQPQETIRYDVTRPGQQFNIAITSGIAVFGIPVYAGRVPELCLERMRSIKGRGTPAVLIALYGNRAFEDALVELQDMVTARGFNVIAAGAFIGEHSYATAEFPVAQNRPDADDLAKAVGMGREAASKIERQDLDTPVIAGNRPYRDRVRFGGIAPEVQTDKCALCGHCKDNCPAGVIKIFEKTLNTTADNCIMCCACIKKCARMARSFSHPFILEKRQLLAENCSQPKAPDLFI